MDLFAPTQFIADFITYRLFSLTQGSYLANAANFFIYDVLKITILLILINYLMAIIRHYFPMGKVREILTTRRWYGLDYLFAALLGVITPFCSCSSIPLFMGLLSANIPIGIIFTFLISSPLVNESSLYLFPAIFGIKVSLLYNILGVFISILGGMLIQKLNMERFIQPEFLKIKNTVANKIKKNKTDITNKKNIPCCNKSQKNRFKHKNNQLLFKKWWQESMTITKSIYIYVLVGVGIGAVIHGYIPEDFVLKYLANKNLWSIPAATLMGVPLYANSVSIIPIIEAFVNKGVPVGSAITFMTATVTLSLPEALLLKKILRWQLLATFFGITIFGIMLIGLVFNFIF